MECRGMSRETMMSIPGYFGNRLFSIVFGHIMIFVVSEINSWCGRKMLFGAIEAAIGGAASMRSTEIVLESLKFTKALTGRFATGILRGVK